MLIFFQELCLQLFLWLLQLIDGFMEIFSAISGVTNVSVNGQSVNIIEYLAGNSTVNTIFWCIFILAVGLTCIFTIVGLVKNMIANNRNVSTIVGKFFLALLGTMAMLAVVFLGILIANAQMLLVFRFIEQEVINARERNKNGANLRTLIIADEAHLYIDPKFPIALDFFYSMSKRIRKYNGSFIPATQNIADWNANEELRGKTSAIIKNSQYTFIFKLSAPDMKDVLDVYRTGDSFNDEEQRMIISAVTGQAFFVGSTELRACVRIQAGKCARELFSEEKKEEGEIES